MQADVSLESPVAYEQVVLLGESGEEIIASTEEIVKDYFSDIPILAEVARCESTFRHYDEDGNVLRGVVNKGDVGVMQINEYYHLESSKEMGLDIHELEDNMIYARHLYEKKGLSPWRASSKCWAGDNSDSFKLAKNN